MSVLRPGFRQARASRVKVKLAEQEAFLRQQQGGLLQVAVQVASFFQLGFMGRLRWLLTGHFDPLAAAVAANAAQRKAAGIEE